MLFTNTHNLVQYMCTLIYIYNIYICFLIYIVYEIYVYKYIYSSNQLSSIHEHGLFLGQWAIHVKKTACCMKTSVKNLEDHTHSFSFATKGLGEIYSAFNDYIGRRHSIYGHRECKARDLRCLRILKTNH